MKAALITNRYPPETSPGAKRARDLAEALHAAGHTITVLTQVPNYPDPDAFSYEVPEGVNLQKDRDPAGFPVWRHRPTIVSKDDLVRRLAAETRFAVHVSRRGTRLRDLDCVIASTPFIFNLAAARSYRVPMWLDVRDLTWEYASQIGSRSFLKGAGGALLRRVALSNLRAASRVSTTTESQRQYLIQNGLDAKKVEVIPNGVPRAIVDKLARRAAAAKRADGPIKLVYAGLLGFPQGLELAVATVAEMAGEGVELHLFGDGVDRQKLVDQVNSKGLRHVFLHGHVSYERYLDALIDADILYASLIPEVQSAMPSKIWEYMAAAKPVLFAGMGEAPDAIERAQAGLTVPYGDRQPLQVALRRLINDDALRQQLGANGRRWVCERQIREDINRTWVERLSEAFAAQPTPR